MPESCDVTGLWLGPLFAAVGATAFIGGVAAWLRPSSPIVRAMVRPFSPSSRIGSIRLDMLRGLVPLVGTAFGLAGWYVTSLTVRCVTTIPRAAQDALAAALAIALVIGVIAGIWGVLRGPR